MATQYVLMAIASVVAVLAVVLAVVGSRRRLDRGRPARFGIGISLIDVIEGLTGKELSPRTHAKIFFVAVGVGLLLAAIGGAILLVLQRGAS